MRSYSTDIIRKEQKKTPFHIDPNRWVVFSGKRERLDSWRNSSSIRQDTETEAKRFVLREQDYFSGLRR